MAIIQDDNSLVSIDPIETNVELQNVTINSTNYNNITVDNRWLSRISLLTHVEGSNWKVDYYSQVLTTDSNPSPPQMSVSPPYQQYKLIRGLNLKVVTSLTSTQNEDDNTMVVTGDSYILNSIIPNDGDCFVVDIGHNTKALFVINRVIKQSIYKDAVYQISYVLDTTDVNKIENIESKVVEELYYNEDYITLGKDPLVTSGEYNSLLNLENQYKTMVKFYLNKFISKEFSTLVLPDQFVSIYDPFLTEYVLNLINTEECGDVIRINKLNVDEDENYKTYNFWDLLKTRDLSLLPIVFKQFGLVSSYKFCNTPYTFSIRYSGINRVIYPITDEKSTDNSLFDHSKILDDISINNTPLEFNDIRKYNDGNYYVLSNNFYTHSNTISNFENMVYKYINNEEVDIDEITTYVNEYMSYSLLKQYYLLPIIITLVRSLIRR